MRSERSTAFQKSKVSRFKATFQIRYPMKSSIYVCLLFCFLIFRLDAWRAKIEITDRVVAALPASIEPEGFAMRNVRTGLFSALISDNCGITAIRFTDATAKKINDEGLSFFEGAKRNRSNTARRRGPVVYEDWQKLPESFARSIGDSLIIKWSQKSGQVAKVYPIDLKGYENGETPEFFGRV